MKEKKITVKPFLNKNISQDGETFPLYFQITFQRKNTQIKSHFNKSYENLDEALKKEKESIKFEQEMFQRVVDFEYKRHGNEFSLKKLKDKYEAYLVPLPTVISLRLRKRLMKVYVQTNSEFQSIIRFDGFDVDFGKLLKASRLLIPRFDSYLAKDFKDEMVAYEHLVKYLPVQLRTQTYLPLMDWVDKNCAESFHQNLMELMNSKEADKTIATICAIIDEKINFISSI
jgi:hypothetical protein